MRFEPYELFPSRGACPSMAAAPIKYRRARHELRSSVIREPKVRKAPYAGLRPIVYRLLMVLGVGLFCLTACSEPQLTIQEIRALHAAGQYQQSIEPLRRLVKEAPTDSERLYLYGHALWSIGRVGLAFWPLKVAMEDPTYLLPAGRLFVQAMILNEAWGEAEAACDLMLDGLGENATVLTLRAYARQGSRKNYVGTIEDADRVLELEPDNTEVLIPRTVALLALKRVDEAGEALRELDELYRDESLGLEGSPKFCTAGAVFAMEKGEADLARERFEHCLKKFPTSSILLAKAIEFFDSRKEFDRSLEIFERALEVEPDSQGLRDDMAIRLDAMDRREDALAVLEEATSRESMIAQIRGWTSLAGFYSSIGKADEAVLAYEEALGLLSSPSPDLDFRYADTLIQAKRYEDALAFADRMNVAPHQSLVRGRSYLEMGDPLRALEYFSEGNRLWPNNVAARYYTAIAAERAGQVDRAIEEYRYAMRIEPGTTDAALRLAHYYIALNEDSSSISVLTMGLTGDPNSMEMQLLGVRVMAKLGIWNQAPKSLVAWVGSPPILAAGSVAIAEGIRDRDGLEKAVAYIEKVKRLDLTNTRDAVALARLIEWLPQVGRAEEALGLARKSLEADPDEPIFQALYADALAATRTDPALVTAAYEKALESNESQPNALRGLADVLASRAEGRARAIDLYRKSIELDSSDASAPKALAESLLALNRPDEAVAALEKFSHEQPWDANGALSLAESLLDLGGEKNLVRARYAADRARRLGNGTGRFDRRLEMIEARLEAAIAEPTEVGTLGDGFEDQPPFDRKRARRRISSGISAASIHSLAAASSWMSQ